MSPLKMLRFGAIFSSSRLLFISWWTLYRKLEWVSLPSSDFFIPLLLIPYLKKTN